MTSVENDLAVEWSIIEVEQIDSLTSTYLQLPLKDLHIYKTAAWLKNLLLQQCHCGNCKTPVAVVLSVSLWQLHFPVCHMYFHTVQICTVHIKRVKFIRVRTQHC